MHYVSEIPSVHIPAVDTYTFVFDSQKSAATHSKIAIIDSFTDEKWTYAELREKIGRFASGIADTWGVKKGSVVGVFSPNSIEYPVVTFGVQKAGGAVTLANPNYTADELAYQLKDAGASSLITTVALLPTAGAAAKKAGIPANRILLFGAEKKAGLKTIRDIVNGAKGVLPTVKRTEQEIKNEAAYLCYSSGTTGRSKGVDTTHYNMVANVAQINALLLRHAKPNEVFTGVLPFYHIYGLNLSLHIAFYTFSTLIVFPKFDLPQFLASIQKYRITVAHIVPPIVIGLAKHPIVEKFDLSSLRTVMSGAAPLGAEVAEECGRRCKCVVIQGYGMTESSPVTHVVPEDDPVPGSIGKLVPNVQCRIVDPDTDEDCPVNKPGELWVRGPNIMKGYHNNPEATRHTIDAEGYLHTGDIAYVDQKGFFFIVDRLKELIKYKGLQVAPAELEAHLLTHPAVADAAVIGIPDADAGEVPRAFVVLKPGVTGVKDTDIAQFIESKVARHKKLRGGVKFIPEIPKAASGKILRRVLRDSDRAAAK
ncbi:hypothetical protein HK104_010199, partial [Borealophlyctis nickersoniae]